MGSKGDTEVNSTSKKTKGEVSCYSPSEFIEEHEIACGKWLSLNKITYKDPLGKIRQWESCYRTTRVKDGAGGDAVGIVAILRRLLMYDCLILVKQFRPPMKKYTIEFPAGLLDPGESIEEAAIRELKEETGYSGVVKCISPFTSIDPGMGNTTVALVNIEIDGNDNINRKVKKHEDDAEFIDVLLVPLNGLMKSLKEFSESGCCVDTFVYSYAVGLDQGSNNPGVEHLHSK